MIEKEWITLIGTISGVLAGGGITSFVKYFELKHQRKQENRKILLTKLEELHQSISNFVSILPEYGYEVLLSNESEQPMSPAKYTEIVAKIYKPLSQPNTLLHIYAPELAGKWKELSDSLQQLHQFGSLYVQNEIDKDTNDQMLVLNQSVIDRCNDLLSLIEKKSQIIANS